jgi:hypothetical protein
MIGPASVAKPALASRNFFAWFNPCSLRFDMIASILRLMLAPDTPDTHAIGDSV